jgi:hypothetical protein
MIEVHSLINDIRAAELRLSSLATKRAEAAASAENADLGVAEIGDRLRRLRLTEQTLSETGQRLHAMAGRAIARGLTQSEIQDSLQPLALKAQIKEATGLLIKALDVATNDSLTLQRILSQAQEELKTIEAEFATAEDALEALRDDLRILQAMPA